jgi:hypothetical protein
VDKDQVQELEFANKDDPLAMESPSDAKRLAEAGETLVSRLESHDLYQSTRRGILPPGVNSKTWFDQDHAWAYGMSVYAPSLSSAATRSATEMQESQILQPNGRKASGQRSGGFTDEKGTEVKRPGKVIKPGPTGKIGPDEYR